MKPSEPFGYRAIRGVLAILIMSVPLWLFVFFVFVFRVVVAAHFAHRPNTTSCVVVTYCGIGG